MSHTKDLEKIYRTLVLHMGEGAGLVDADERFLYANPAADEIFGVQRGRVLRGRVLRGRVLRGRVLPGQLVGRLLTDFLSPEQLQIMNQQTAQRRQGKKSTYELEILRPNGEKRTLLVTATPFDEQAPVYQGAYAIFRDITEYKRSEQDLQRRVAELQMLNEIVQALTQETDLVEALNYVARRITELLDASSCGIALLDENLHGLRVAAQYRSRVDIPDETGTVIPLTGNVATQKVLAMLRPEVVQNAQDNPDIASANALMQRQVTHSLLLAPLLARGSVIGTIGVNLDDPDRRFSAVEIALVETIAGQISGVVEMTRLYGEALQTRQAAEQANRTKSTFLANMSHELRTPLTVIIGYSEMLLEWAQGDTFGRFRERLEKIRVSGQHLLSLINDVLDLSKIEAGRLEILPEFFPVERVLSEVATAARPLADKNDNQFVVDAPEMLGKMYGDPLRIRQVLLNLISNACKFTDHGRVTLSVVRAPLGEQEWLHFSVIDTGIGIKPEQMEQLFQPFSQAEETTTRRFGGTGLGLAISKQLAQMMGGSIDLVSQVGYGSTFTLHLPVEMQQ